MIRVRRLRPREVRSIRHWAIELAVVVVGVLLALWAAEWAEERREEAAHAASIEALDRENDISFLILARTLMADQCITGRLVELRDLLLEQGDWPGYAPSVENGESGTKLDTVLPYPTNYYSTATHHRARETGALENLDDELELSYEEVFLAIDSADKDNEELRKLLPLLAPLRWPGPLSSRERREMIALIARIEALHEASKSNVRHMLRETIGTDRDPRRRGEEFVTQWLGENQLRSVQGDCVEPFDFEAAVLDESTAAKSAE